ncbi:uncharacterized protein LOC133033845 [Cannabis sativa]|uniref:uncharacterized protein LOC133033845 n=1 Tax=Cannabis sativa TaxID=3483 RepID=UPI0029CA9112|nr:uncharacterized protein LOC133033845 [Cannabis sativa]
MTVTEYATKFDRLAKFASDEVASDATRKAKFIRGLEEYIARDSTQRKDVWKTSSGTEVSKSFSPSDRKRKPDGPPVVGPNRKFLGNQGFCRGRNKVWQPYLEFSKCKRHHLGECRSRVCYPYGVAGHFMNNYPQPQKSEANKEIPMVSARVFSLTQADAEADPSTVTGEISIGGIMFTILVDSGATHSYISSRIIEKLGRPCDIMSYEFGTLLPTREVVISKRWVRSLLVLVEGRELLVDLIELDLEDFDVILGMDWLTKYNATIDGKRKMVTFEPKGETPFVFMGKVQGSRIPMISALRTSELLQEGCMGYLASVLDTTKDILKGSEKV